ncbi:MAG TPA: alpha/beta hydrolase [Azospirillaceae bacterium]|nr:alpha/beta hydrolase [Azospirillaceae bacterium]
MVRGVRSLVKAVVVAGLTLGAAGTAFATPGAPAAPGVIQADPGIWLAPAFPGETAMGPRQAKGIFIWSHGRSVTSEDSDAPSPPYLRALHEAGWDVLRYNRLRSADTLQNSSRVLARLTGELKGKGYRKVVLAGQSFGAFISLITAGSSDDVDGVVGTAPAAYGSFTEAFGTWKNNADRFYPLLQNVRRARVMLFFFHGDDFDPGGRGEKAKAILGGRGLDNLVIDQPPYLVGHGAAGTGLFVRRFGGCIARFAERALTGTDPACDEAWGEAPSAQLAVQALPGASAVSDLPTEARPYFGKWYGFYVNGRETVLSVESVQNGKVVAEYVLGPGVSRDQKSERVRRLGRIEGKDLVFDESGRNALRYSIRADGRLAAVWSDHDSDARLEATMRRLD